MIRVFCQRCKQMMLVESSREEGILAGHKIKGTGKHWHDRCFIAMAKEKGWFDIDKT